jgi:hypothetical protein
MRKQIVAMAFVAFVSLLAALGTSSSFASGGTDVPADAVEKPPTDEFQPYTLTQALRLPNGDLVAPRVGDTVAATKTEQGTLQEVTIKDSAGHQHWHLKFKDDGTTVDSAEEYRSDGTLKSKIETDGTEMTVTLYYPDGKTEFSKVTIDSDSGQKSVSYNYPDGIVALEQTYDKTGLLTSEYVRDHDGSVVRSVDASFENDDTHIDVTYSGDDHGTPEFYQHWTAPLGSPAPQVTVRWSNDKNETVLQMLTLTPDGRRVINRSIQNDDGTISKETISGDGQFVVHRTIMHDETTISEQSFNGKNRPPIDLRPVYLTPPPPPTEIESLGLKTPR